jgi:membrane-associated phospholipid phosphatase
MRFVHWMYQDLGGLAAATLTPETGLYVLGGAAVTAGLVWLDDDLQDASHHLYTGPGRDVLDVLDYVGGPKINLPVVLVAGGSLLTGDTRFQDAAFTSLQTLVYAGLLGYGLKGLFGRRRPEATDNPYAFFATTGKNPFTAEGNSSYPSGHAIAAFGIITPWVLYYPHPVTYALYLVPTGTVLSRLALDKHWATDIAVGATIGVLMGRFLTNRHKARQGGAAPPLELSVLDEGDLVRLRLRF